MELYRELWMRTAADSSAVKKLAHDMGLFLPLAQVLVSKGIDTKEKASRYLEPNLQMLNELGPLENTDRAVEKILETVNGGLSILVYGDYDVDGVTSTTLLTSYLKRLGATVSCFIPNRMEDGYGIHIERLRERLDSFDLLITVDCGITAVEPVEELLAEGKAVIVTDHHQPKEILPGGILVNPKCSPENYQDYAGVGVAYQLVKALEKITGVDAGFDALAFAAIGTVADLMPLTGNNRLIVKLGLEHMVQVENKGLKALMAAMQLDPAELTASDIGFKLAPAINASGRLGSALDALELFMSEDEMEIQRLASFLKESNDQRKEVEKGIVEDAVQKVDPSDNFIVVRGDDWHDGVIGIVASRLVDKFRKPAIVMTRKGDCYKGSGRSVGEFDLLESLNACSEAIAQYGGHKFAAGLSIEADRFTDLKSQLNDYADRVLTPMDQARQHRFVSSLEAGAINAKTVELIGKLAPFGRGNPKPLFVFDDARVSYFKTMGAGGEHLKVNIQMDNRMVDAVGFNQGNKLGRLSKGQRISLVGSLDTNVYLGVEYINIYFKDFRSNDLGDLLGQPEYAGYIAALANLVSNYHREALQRDYLSPLYAIEQGLQENSLQVDLDTAFDGRVEFSDLADLKEPRNQEWVEKQLIRQLPDRRNLVDLYKKVETAGEILLKIFDESSSEIYNCNMEIIAGRILSELGLMECLKTASGYRLKRIPHDRKKKMDLNQSKTFSNLAIVKEDWNEFKRQD